VLLELLTFPPALEDDGERETGKGVGVNDDDEGYKVQTKTSQIKFIHKIKRAPKIIILASTTCLEIPLKMLGLLLLLWKS